MSYASLFRNVLYPLYETFLRKRKTLAYYSEYDQSQWKSLQELEKVRIEKLRNLLQHCQTNVPYYKEEWSRLGFDWRDVQAEEHISQLPPITKEIIRARYDDFKSRGPLEGVLTKKTGGTTGVPFQFDYSRESYERRVAVAQRGYGWAGAHPGVKRLDVWGVDILPAGVVQDLKSRAMNLFFRRKVLSCFDLNDQNIEKNIQQIEEYRPEVIVGYVSALKILARWILANRKPICQPKSIITAAEMLSNSDRKLIEEAFNAPVFHSYGCREFMLIGSECEFHSGYHLSYDHLVVQVLNERSELVREGIGRMAITDLHNYAMPFVRYLNGDMGEVNGASLVPCPCGRGLPRLSNVIGRQLDQIRTPDGRILPGEFFPHLFKDFESVRQFQVLQKSLSELKVKLVLDPGDHQDELGEIERLIRQRLGSEIKLNIERVDKIELTASGKLRVTISEVVA